MNPHISSIHTSIHLDCAHSSVEGIECVQIKAQIVGKCRLLDKRMADSERCESAQSRVDGTLPLPSYEKRNDVVQVLIQGY